MANPFVHVELNTTDVDKAKKFYGNRRSPRTLEAKDLKNK